MFAYADLLMMFPQQLLADCVSIFGDDPDQAVDILRVVADELGEFLHLRFEVLQAPLEAFLVHTGRLFLGSRYAFFRQRRHQHILFHIHPFNPTARMNKGFRQP